MAILKDLPVNSITNTYTYTINKDTENVYINTNIQRIDIIQYGKLKTIKDIQHTVNAMFTSYINNGYTILSVKSDSYISGEINYYESIAKAEKNNKCNLYFIVGR